MNNGHRAIDYAKRHNSNPEIVRMIEDAGASEMAQSDSESPERKGSDEKAENLMSDLLSIPGRVIK